MPGEAKKTRRGASYDMVMEYLDKLEEQEGPEGLEKPLREYSLSCATCDTGTFVHHALTAKAWFKNNHKGHFGWVEYMGKR